MKPVIPPRGYSPLGYTVMRPKPKCKSRGGTTGDKGYTVMRPKPNCKSRGGTTGDKEAATATAAQQEAAQRDGPQDLVLVRMAAEAKQKAQQLPAQRDGPPERAHGDRVAATGSAAQQEAAQRDGPPHSMLSTKEAAQKAQEEAAQRGGPPAWVLAAKAAGPTPRGETLSEDARPEVVVSRTRSLIVVKPVMKWHVHEKAMPGKKRRVPTQPSDPPPEWMQKQSLESQRQAKAHSRSLRTPPRGPTAAPRTRPTCRPTAMPMSGTSASSRPSSCSSAPRPTAAPGPAVAYSADEGIFVSIDEAYSDTNADAARA